MFLSNAADFPHGLQGVACRHESLVSDDIKKNWKILKDTVLGIALCQVAKYLCGNGAVPIVFVFKLPEYFIPDIVNPVDYQVR